MENENIIFETDYSFETIKADKKDISILANSFSIENSGATVATVKISGTSRTIKVNQIISFNNDYDTIFNKNISISFVGSAGEIIITKQTYSSI